MLKQSDIVERVNRLAVGYTVHWDDIKYDADKAIMKINDFLGANFPPMSKILDRQEATYSVRGVQIIKDQYILSIVVPFIAMEILARDEEFTTVFNKFAQDVDDALFSMFQREFNNIPSVFLQGGDVGVFFPNTSSIAEGVSDKGIDVFRFSVQYALNNTNIVGTVRAPVDTVAYKYRDHFTVMDMPTREVISSDGIFVYKFAGWYGQDGREYPVGAVYELLDDVILTARWEKFYTLSVNNHGLVSIKDPYVSLIKNLSIPSHIEGRTVRRLKPNFFEQSPQIESVRLPNTFQELDNSMVSHFKGSALHIEPLGVPMSIASGTFASVCPNLKTIIIPKRVNAIGSNAFAFVDGRVVYCEILEQNKPQDWDRQWDNGVRVEWGYHG
jgi:hypothetical protein